MITGDLTGRDRQEKIRSVVGDDAADRFGRGFDGCVESAVGNRQDFELGDTEDVETSLSLRSAARGVGLSVLGDLGTARRVGEVEDTRLGIGPGQLGEKSATAEDLIIEMGREDQNSTSRDCRRFGGRCEIELHRPVDSTPSSQL